MTRRLTSWLFGLTTLLGTNATAGAEGDPQQGAQAFRQCAACHSVEPGRHLTGPSLAGMVGRPAGTVEGFTRYSDALSTSGLTWDAATLERWLADPATLVPGTSMVIAPIDDPGMRRDVVAFLEAAQGASSSGASGMSPGGGMMGGMRGGRMPNLKEPTAKQHVTAMSYCGDAYRVTLGTGKTFTFWEFNLRFKTDSSPDGPPSGAPAIVGQGMMGDRAQVVFAAPAEISDFIRKECPSG
jgi:cytochrome c